MLVPYVLDDLERVGERVRNSSDGGGYPPSMNERAGWGAAIASVCSAELIFVVVITGAGLASVFVPDYIEAIALGAAILAVGALYFQRRRVKCFDCC